MREKIEDDDVYVETVWNGGQFDVLGSAEILTR